LLHERDVAKLKLQWNSIRSKFSVAFSNCSKSGQGDPEMFPSFTQGDNSLLYTFCVFDGKPAMEQKSEASARGCAKRGRNKERGRPRVI
jgi:hypothetical protein